MTQFRYIKPLVLENRRQQYDRRWGTILLAIAFLIICVVSVLDMSSAPSGWAIVVAMLVAARGGWMLIRTME